jgi:G3E family GTPase
MIAFSSGVADPGPVISSLWVDDSLGSCLALDSVVTVVDLKNITGQLLDDTVRSIVEKQIAYADRILLNKADIATEADVILFSSYKVFNYCVKHYRLLQLRMLCAQSMA